MGELSNAVLDIYTNRPLRDYFGISSISPCPRETYLNYRRFLETQETGLGPPIENRQQLLMDDGHYQEAMVLSLLRRAGYVLEYTGKAQFTVTVGRAKVPGHPDGINKGRLGLEYPTPKLLEVKAMNYSRFKSIVREGLESEPKIKCQVQLYMAGEGLPYPVKECQVFCKHKETSNPEDILERKDEKYSATIIEMVDAIILDGWEPKPIRNPLCKGCRVEELCWQELELDLSGFQIVDLPETSAKWIQGKAFVDLGTAMVDSAKEEFGEVMETGTRELMTGLLRILKSQYPKRSFNKNRFIREKGQAEYDRFCDEIIVTSLRPSIL